MSDTSSLGSNDISIGEYSKEYLDKPKIYGYFRLYQTEGEDERKKYHRMVNYYNGTHSDHVYYDTYNSSFGIMGLLSICKSTDTIIIPSLGRFVYSPEHLLSLYKEVEKKGVTIKFIKTRKCSWEDVEKYVSVYKLLKQIKKERQIQGVKVSKEKGNYKGRKPLPLPNNFNYYVKEYEKEGSKLKSYQIESKLGMSHSTFFRRYKEYKEKRKKSEGV